MFRHERPIVEVGEKRRRERFCVAWLDEKSRLPVDYHLGQRASPGGDHRSPACHRLHSGEPKRFDPIVRRRDRDVAGVPERGDVRGVTDPTVERDSITDSQSLRQLFELRSIRPVAGNPETRALGDRVLRRD